MSKIKYNYILFTADDFETSKRPNEKGVYAWLTGYSVIGIFDKDKSEWIEDISLYGVTDDHKVFYGKNALSDYLDSKMELTTKMKELKVEVKSFFHNAKYDYSYIQYHILKYCGGYNNKTSKYYISRPVIDENNIFYSANINKRIRKKAAGKKRIDEVINYTIHDLYKIFPSSLKDIGDSVGVPKLDENFDYDRIISYDYIPSENDLKYFYNDIEIMKVAYKKAPNFFYGYYTIGSIVKNYYLKHLSDKNIYKDDLFPSDKNKNIYSNVYSFHKGELCLMGKEHIKDVYRKCLYGYKGGMTICNNKYMGKTIYNDKLPIEYIPKNNYIKISDDIYHYDVNSLYPSVMESQSYPIGIPKIIESEYDDRVNKEIANQKLLDYLIHEMNNNYKLIILNLTIYSIKVKKGKAPLYLKKPMKRVGLEPYKNDITEENCYSSFYNEDSFISECITLNEFLILKENYDIHFKIDNAMVFNTFERLFSEFINELNSKKIKYDNDKFLRLCYKLCMNNLYGKFGEQIDKITLLRDLEENGEWLPSATCKQIEKESSFFYPPIAVFVTSYARIKMINFINMVGWNNVLYMDTDSIHLIGKENANILNNNGVVDSVKLGYLKLEDICYAEKTLSPKKYCYYGKDNKKGNIEFTCKCAGLPKKAQDFIKPYSLIHYMSPFDKFDYELSFVPESLLNEVIADNPNLNFVPCGKLSQRYIIGGISLDDGIFAIRTPKILQILSEKYNIPIYQLIF